MSTHSKIEWTEATWNPVTGCTKVSAGCKHCYAERDWARLSANPKARYYGRAFTDVQCHDNVLLLPERWSKPRRIFVNSMSDLFHYDVPDQFIRAVFGVMAAARQHTFQILTKRPRRMRDLLMDWHRSGLTLREGCGVVLPNVWIGVSVEDQAAADERIPLLLQTPAAVRFVSIEPMLGPVDLRRAHIASRRLPRVDWVIAGGESGPKARPMHPDWVRSLRDQCAAAGVPFLFKQWGEWVPRSACYHTFEDGTSCVDIDPGATKWPRIRLTEAGHNGRDLAHAGEGDHAYMQRIGKKAAGRMLDGVLHDGYPEVSA